jgi:parallel beta-helix repeat protein
MHPVRHARECPDGRRNGVCPEVAPTPGAPMRLPLALFAAGAALAASVTPARAAESYDGCRYTITSLPAVLTSQGVWCLRGDLATTLDSGRAIEIDAPNVTLDCNGFKIGGLAGGPDTTATGIYAENLLNATIRGCNVRGFRTGIFLLYVDGALVEDNTLDGSLWQGIYLRGESGTVRRNRVVDTADTPNLGAASGIGVEGASDIIDNTVAGVSQSYATGIYLGYGEGASVVGNRVRGVAGVNETTGISLYQSPGAFVRDNHVSGPGDQGIRCSVGEAMLIRNAVSGFDTPLDADCLTSGNVVQMP